MKNDWKYEITALGYSWKAANETEAAEIRERNSWTETQVWDKNGEEVKDFDAILAGLK